jgi:hypothetical protein
MSKKGLFRSRFVETEILGSKSLEAITSFLLISSGKYRRIYGRDTGNAPLIGDEEQP